jgi:preprotein translocase subunit SecD
MERKYINLLLILLLVVIVTMVDIPQPPQFINTLMKREVQPVLGLDLRGGIQVLLEPPVGTTFTQKNLEDASKILENRSNGLGVSEVVFQIAGGKYILGEFPGISDTEQVTNIIHQTGLLEFVDAGTTYLEPDTVVETNYATTQNSETTPSTDSQGAVIYQTVMTGADLTSASVGVDPNDPEQLPFIQFELSEAGAQIFKEYTTANVGKYLAIVLDKRVISCPVINSAIPDGQGIIQGNFDRDSANNLATVLRFGSLPVALEVAQSRQIGPVLGEASLRQSLIAGAIGFALVALFMILYYRMPGFLAVLAVIVYALITFAIYKLLPVTLSLPGIAGFLLATGTALDANILIFERLKEELRNGRTLTQAVELGWKRAWPSIRDSNIAAIITSVILFIFGSAYGASIVKGFAVTLSLGVLVSLFTAVFIVRTFLNIAVDFINPAKRNFWFGL